MQVETFRWSSRDGWSVPRLPALDSPQTLVLAFGGSSLAEAPQPLRELAAAYPTSCVAGCSTSGEILGSEIRDDGLSVAVVRFDDTTLRFASAPVERAADSEAAGEALARALVGPGLTGVLVLSDGLQVNGTPLVAGINKVVPAGTVVTGGLAGDGTRFQKTWVLVGGEPRSGFVTAVGFAGSKVKIGHGSQGGWDIFGPERTITRSEGNVLFEIDGQPALDLYKTYLGERASGLPATGLLFPLAIRRPEGDGRQLVRTILAVDEAAKSLTFAGDVPVGWRGQLMKANFERLIGGAVDAANVTRERSGHGDSTLAVAISCVGRRLVLGERTEEEAEATLANLPPGTRQVGFYSYGELSPYVGGNCDLHNQTMTLTTITEE
jgi:hypothetical protein